MVNSSVSNVTTHAANIQSGKRGLSASLWTKSIVSALDALVVIYSKI